jgi:hypothetical protein
MGKDPRSRFGLVDAAGRGGLLELSTCRSGTLGRSLILTASTIDGDFAQGGAGGQGGQGDGFSFYLTPSGSTATRSASRSGGDGGAAGAAGSGYGGRVGQLYKPTGNGGFGGAAYIAGGTVSLANSNLIDDDAVGFSGGPFGIGGRKRDSGRKRGGAILENTPCSYVPDRVYTHPARRTAESLLNRRKS